MSQLSSLGGINTDLQFKPGGNPYADLATGGLAGLGNAYGQTYNSALAANQANYNNVVGGYKNLAGQVGNILGQGGTPWGVAQPAAQAIQDTLASAKGGAIQNSINRGLGGSTAAVAAQRGANLDAEKAYGSLGAQLAQTYAGYTANLGQGMLGAMQNTNIPFPNGNEYSNLYQQYGQQQQSQQNMALLAQQSMAQQQLARRAASAGQISRGGGGVNIPQMPRGGTFGSGGGGFPSGGAAELQSGLFGRGNTMASGTGPAPISLAGGQSQAAGQIIGGYGGLIPTWGGGDTNSMAGTGYEGVPSGDYTGSSAMYGGGTVYPGDF